jgi:hypothetical protein
LAKADLVQGLYSLNSVAKNDLMPVSCEAGVSGMLG